VTASCLVTSIAQHKQQQYMKIIKQVSNLQTVKNCMLEQSILMFDIIIFVIS